jgi:[ribosomal protein S5]-alanine N-acetyltransferase
VEKLPYHLEPTVERVVPAEMVRSERRSHWRSGLPELAGSLVTLRELRSGDAVALFTAMTNAEVTRFISPPPATVNGFERFIAWTHRQREAGLSVSFAIVERGSDVAIGVFQVRSLDLDFGTAEWGFAMAREFWGTGMFVDGARLLVEFVFDVIGTHRLEARVAVINTPGNAALKKLGAMREGVLRKSFLRHGEFLDQSLWTLLADEWRDAQMPVVSPAVH